MKWPDDGVKEKANPTWITINSVEHCDIIMTRTSCIKYMENDMPTSLTLQDLHKRCNPQQPTLPRTNTNKTFSCQVIITTLNWTLWMRTREFLTQHRVYFPARRVIGRHQVRTFTPTSQITQWHTTQDIWRHILGPITHDVMRDENEHYLQHRFIYSKWAIRWEDINICLRVTWHTRLAAYSHDVVTQVVFERHRPPKPTRSSALVEMKVRLEREDISIQPAFPH